MRLVATYSFSYGRKGPMDKETPIVERGDQFEVLPTSIASADEVARFMQRDGTAVTPEVWAKRKPIADINWNLAQDMVAKANAAKTRRVA